MTSSATTTPTLLKHGLGESAVRRQCVALQRAVATYNQKQVGSESKNITFDTASYANDALTGIDAMALKERVKHMIKCLHKQFIAIQKVGVQCETGPAETAQSSKPPSQSSKAHPFKYKFKYVAPILSHCAQQNVFPSAPAQATTSQTATDDASAEPLSLSGFAPWPLIDYVGEYGLDDPEIALPLLAEMTPMFTAEFAIRPFVINHFDLAFQFATKWCHDENEHVRRLASEGFRPRLPWGLRVQSFCKDPTPIIPLLSKLKDDPSLYVRKSVANSINDISKDHPDLVVKICREWMGALKAIGSVADDGKDLNENENGDEFAAFPRPLCNDSVIAPSGGNHCEANADSKKSNRSQASLLARSETVNNSNSIPSERTQWIIRHGTRSLIKQGHLGAMALFGFDGGEAVLKRVRCDKLTVLRKGDLELPKNAVKERQFAENIISELTIKVGDSVSLEFNLLNLSGDEPQNVVVDFAIIYAAASNQKKSVTMGGASKRETVPGKKRSRSEERSPSGEVSGKEEGPAKVNRNSERRKVFKLTNTTLTPSESRPFTKAVSFRPISTRKYYTGEHAIEIIVNGQVVRRITFTLLAPDK